MNQVSNNPITSSTDTQSADRSLLEYLKPKSEDRFSKLEAYCDLLSRASSGAFVAANGERREELVPGQFVASISELARKWKWQRATVRSFVEGLVALGQLSYKPFVKSYIFTVNLQQRLSLYVDSADDVLDFCCMQFARYIKGRSSAHEVADSYDRYYAMKMEVACQQEQGGAPVRHVLRHQAYMFNELASAVYHLLDREENVPDELSDSVTLLFGKDHLWNWHRVIDVLGILTVALRDNVKPSYMNAVVKDYTKAEVTLLDCIYEHYAPSNGSNYFVNPPKPSGYVPKSLRSTATVADAEKAPKSPQDASETTNVASADSSSLGVCLARRSKAEGQSAVGADTFSEGETLRQDSAEGIE